MQTRFLGLSISVALLCISCGGGGGSSSSSTLANAEGQYRSNVGSGGGGYNYLYVLPDGSAYVGNTGTGWSGGRFVATEQVLPRQFRRPSIIPVRSLRLKATYF